MEAINEYAAVFKEGIPYAVLSRKYMKKLNQQGSDLDKMLIELKNQQLINIYMKRNGMKLITPKDESQIKVPEVFQRV